MSPSALTRFRAERLLRKEFSALRSKVLAIVRSQLRAKGVALDHTDLEAAYAQAWHGLYATVLEGEQVENPSAWLVLVTFRRAIDESRSASRAQMGGGDSQTALDAGASGYEGVAFAPDMAADLDDRAQLRQLFEGLRTRLTARECEAASLCYLQGLPRAQAAERMGISQTRMRKLMEGSGGGSPGVAGKVGGLLETIKAGGWCEQQASLMRAFAFGVLDPEGERHALALAHCRECSACRAHVASLRGLASVLPLPLLSPLALTGGAATATSGTAAGGSASSGAGWGGFAGSLTAKLALTVLIVLGGGYAVLGSRAHGSPSARHGVVRAPLASPTPSEAPPATHAPHHLPVRVHRASARRASSSRGARTLSQATAPEFGPERVLAEPAGPRARSSSPSVGEFGIE